MGISRLRTFAFWSSVSLSCAALTMIGTAIVACGGGDTPAIGSEDAPAAATVSYPPTPLVVAATVGSLGGTLINSDGTGVEIPAGALANDVTVSVTPTPDAPAPTGATSVGTATTMGPSGLKFAKPVRVLLRFDATKLPRGVDASRIVVFTAADGSKDYSALPTSVRDPSHVAAETTHFSVFVPVIPPPSIDAGPVGPHQDACVPATCSSLGAGTCGHPSDGCGGGLDCGPCSEDAGTRRLRKGR